MRRHRAIKRIVEPLIGINDFGYAHIILSGIEIMLVIHKGSMQDEDRRET